MKCMDSDKKVSETQSNKNEVDRKAKHTIPFQTFLVFHPSMSRKSFIARGNAKLYLILSILVVRGIMPLDAIGDTDIDVPLHIFWRSKELPGMQHCTIKDFHKQYLKWITKMQMRDRLKVISYFKQPAPESIKTILNETGRSITIRSQ